MPFQVPVPDTCALVGAQLSTQAASIDPALAIQLTNALDVEIGAY